MEQGGWMTGWMNEQVKGEIEDVRRKHGFEEKEAVAYWHIRRAEILISRISLDDEKEKEREREEEDDGIDNYEWLGITMVRTSYAAVRSEMRYGQHFAALYRELGRRVLRRDYPEGWGGDPAADVPQEWLQPPPDIEGEPEG